MNRQVREMFRASAVVATSALLAVALPAQQTAARLTLADAIEKGLKANLGVLLAQGRVDEAQATRLRALAASRLPRMSAEAYGNLHSTDLRAQGLSFKGVPEVAGPLANYDFRVAVQQNVIDLVSTRTLRATERGIDVSKMDERDARDTVVRTVAAIYLNAESAAARARSAQSRVGDGETLLKLARDKHDAGTATGVDVLRAQVQLANDRQALLVAENQQRIAVIELERTIGVDPGTPVELAETLDYRPLEQPQIETAKAEAIAGRADYLSLAAEREQLRAQQQASHARFYPKFSLSGNVGEIGRTFGDMRATGAIQGQIDITLFDRDREGEAAVLASRIRRIDDQIADLRRGIDQDLREALLNLDSAAQQVDVARQGEELARRELEMARDRFQAGTANNVEVVTAQDELARAEENAILAVSSHMDAKFALARAVGGTADKIAEFMKR